MDQPLRIILKPRVADDLERQVRYLDLHASSEVGDRYLASVHATITQLAEMPSIGSHHEHPNPRLRGFQKWQVPDFRKHSIFYRVHTDAIEVIRILHSAQDIQTILLDEE